MFEINKDFYDIEEDFDLYYEPRDTRYTYTTYESFNRSVYKKVSSNTLLIIDQAHNLRNPSTAIYKLTLKGCIKCDKVICLSATPLINKVYDIEMIMAMVEQRGEKDAYQFAIDTELMSDRINYFKYRISYFQSDLKNDKDYPTVIHNIFTIAMNVEEATAMDKIKISDKAIKSNFDKFNLNKLNPNFEDSAANQYLLLNPDNNVIVISPKSLLANFMR